jgi:hypothetical protein
MSKCEFSVKLDEERVNRLKKQKFSCYDTAGEYCCNDEPIAIIRCKEVCGTHFKIVKADNIKRIEAGEDIPEDFSLLSSLPKRAITKCTRKIS